MLAKKLMGGAGAEEKLYVDDVFSTYLYTGVDSTTLTITNGIDLAGEGGLVWIKHRNYQFGHNSDGHYLVNTVTGNNSFLQTQTTGAVTSAGYGLVFNNNGFTAPIDGGTNYQGGSYASWTFRKAPKFFDVVTWNGDGTDNRAIPHNLGAVPGFFITKTTNASGNWWCYHKDLGASKAIQLNRTDAAVTSTYWRTAPTDSVFYVSADPTGNASGYTYVAYLFAHDTDTDGIIQCGSFSGNTAVSLGWEPQYIMYKRADSTGNWATVDAMRGIPTGSADRELYANLLNEEATSTSDYITLNATGFTTTNLTGTFVYIAIRRPNKPPTSGTEVYNAESFTGTGVFKEIVPTIKAPDLLILRNHRSSAVLPVQFFDRLRGDGSRIKSTDTTTESTQPLWLKFSTGMFASISTDSETNTAGRSEVAWAFRRAPGFFDVVCYTGNSSAAGGTQAISHNLGVVPELIIIKSRSESDAPWFTGTNFRVSLQTIGRLNTSESFQLDFPYAAWLGAQPTLSTFTPINQSTAPYYQNANELSATYVAYLFATLAGVSKVGSYTGNGSSQTINCGFSAGARFILIKRTDSTGDWYVWDSVRGIVAANDPHLSLNSAAAEVTTDDSVDPDNSGFIVNQVVATNINVTSATYIFLAIA